MPRRCQCGKDCGTEITQKSEILPKHIYYDEIPKALFQGANSILDIGAADGWNQTVSIHKDHFLKKRYVGIDPLKQENPYLPIIKDNALEWDTKDKFDLVICMHVIEHISVDCWPELFRRLMKWTTKSGYLVIGCPYNEIWKGISHTVEYSPHLVFEIKPKMLEYYIPDIKTILLGESGRSFVYEEGENYAWVLLRHLRRLLTGHYYAYNWIPKARRIMGVWRND